MMQPSSRCKLSESQSRDMNFDAHPSVTEVCTKDCPFSPDLDEDLTAQPYGMHTIPESLSRCVGLVNIVPKTRYAHVETPSRHVRNEDRPQSAPPRLKVFGRSRTLLCSPRHGVGRLQ